MIRLISYGNRGLGACKRGGFLCNKVSKPFASTLRLLYTTTIQIHCTHYLFGRELINPRQPGNDVSYESAIVVGNQQLEGLVK